MTRARRLQVHLAVQLEVPDGPCRGRYPTRVLDCEGETLDLALPTPGDEDLEVAPGQPVVVEYADRSGLYRLQTRVVAVTREPIAALSVFNPSDQLGVQRREFARLEVAIPVTWAPARPAGEGTSRRQRARVVRRARGGLTVLAPHRRTGRTRDLSAGGMLLVVEDEVRQGAVLNLEFALRDGEPVKCNAEVVRVHGGTAASETPDSVALRFIDLNERDSDRIVGFLFAEEVKRRRAGLV